MRRRDARKSTAARAPWFSAHSHMSVAAAYSSTVGAPISGARMSKRSMYMAPPDLDFCSMAVLAGRSPKPEDGAAQDADHPPNARAPRGRRPRLGRWLIIDHVRDAAAPGARGLMLRPAHRALSPQALVQFAAQRSHVPARRSPDTWLRVTPTSPARRESRCAIAWRSSCGLCRNSNRLCTSSRNVSSMARFAQY